MSTWDIPVASQEGGSLETLPVEQEVALSMEELAARVEQATLNNVKKNAHSSLTEAMKSWNAKGKISDNCPNVLMALPCAVPDH